MKKLKQLSMNNYDGSNFHNAYLVKYSSKLVKT